MGTRIGGDDVFQWIKSLTIIGVFSLELRIGFSYILGRLSFILAISG